MRKPVPLPVIERTRSAITPKEIAGSGIQLAYLSGLVENDADETLVLTKSAFFARIEPSIEAARNIFKDLPRPKRLDDFLAEVLQFVEQKSGESDVASLVAAMREAQQAVGYPGPMGMMLIAMYLFGESKREELRAKKA